MGTACLHLCVALLASEVFGLPPPRYWPLDPGNRWTYVREGFEGPLRPEAARIDFVMGVEGDIYLVIIGAGHLRDGTEARIGGFPDALDIELPGEGLVPYYRFSEESWEHRDFVPCNDRATATAGSREEIVETPSGTYTSCLRLDYGGGGCIDSGTTAEWWAPEVGKVKWTEQSFGGPRTWVLWSFDRGVGSYRFLRGDADSDGSVLITDAIFILGGLFIGGPLPACDDAADTDDTGAVEITDAIYLLSFLFLGGPSPPAPGAHASGFDGTPHDPFACGDPPAVSCGATESSSLPGVRFDLSTVPCVLTLEQAAAGVSFPYRTIIDEDLAGVVSTPLDAGRCDQPDDSGLAAFEDLSGESQRYCLCDVGHCPGIEVTRDLVKGTYESSLSWSGRNWFGPSDTMNPEGDPFPPGTYAFTVRAAGTYRDPDTGEDRPFEVTASRKFNLVP